MSRGGRDGKRTGGEGKGEQAHRDRYQGALGGGGGWLASPGAPCPELCPWLVSRAPKHAQLTTVCPSHGQTLWRDPLGQVPLWVLASLFPAPTTVVTTE